MYTVSGGEDGTGTLVETAVGDVVVMSTPAISSSSGLVVPVVLRSASSKSRTSSFHSKTNH